MIENVCALVLLSVAAAAAIRWRRRGADVWTVSAIFFLFSTPLGPLLELFAWASKPSTKVLWANNPGHLLITSWAGGLQWGLAMAIIGGVMATLFVFVPGWLICYGIKGLADENTFFRSVGKILLGLLLVGFFALIVTTPWGT